MDSEYLKMSIYSPIFTPFWGTKKTGNYPWLFRNLLIFSIDKLRNLLIFLLVKYMVKLL